MSQLKPTEEILIQVSYKNIDFVVELILFLSIEEYYSVKMYKTNILFEYLFISYLY